MKVLFLVPYPLKNSPSQRFRFEQYFDTLEESGIQCIKQSFWDIQAWNILYKKGHSLLKIAGFLRGVLRRLSIIFRTREIDFVFIHRECMPVGPPVIEWIIAKILRKKIIYDFDDAIWLPNTSAENKLAALIKWHSKTKHICRWSYKVSCGNDFLAAYARQFNTHVSIIPTTIDTDNLHYPAIQSDAVKTSVIIGWTGSHSTLKYLDNIQNVLQEIKNRYKEKVGFLIIADQKPVLNLDQFQFIRWNMETEIEDLSQLDIGIMPLPDDIWAQGKCGFKALQYMALEIPAVISPVGVNLKIIQDNMNGFHAGPDNEWINKLSLLIDSAALRKKIGVTGRETVLNHYSVKSQQQNYLNLFLL